MNETLERTLFSLRPTLLFVYFGYGSAALAGILVVILLYYFEQLIKMVFINFSIPFYISVPFGLLPLLIPVYYHLKRSQVLYTLTDARIQISKGFISRRTQNIPLRTIQDVTVSASILSRLFGYGSLIIENAGESNGRIILRNIAAPQKYADLLLNEIRRN